MRKVWNKFSCLFGVLINNDTDFPVTSVYRKKTFTGLLTNYFSFTSHSYKLGLIRTLAERAYKINNTWLGFHEDITKLTKILQKNLFPVHPTLTRQDCNPPASVSDTTRTFYVKLVYLMAIMLPKGRTILSMLAVTLWTEQWRIDLYKTSKAMVTTPMSGVITMSRG